MEKEFPLTLSLSHGGRGKLKRIPSSLRNGRQAPRDSRHLKSYL